MKSDESADDDSLSKINVCRCNTRTLRSRDKGFRTPDSRVTLFFLLLFATRHDTTRDRNHSAVYSAVIKSGGSRCLSATLYKLCDFLCRLGSSPIRVNTSRSLATLARSRASAKPSPADEQQISADSEGRLHLDPLFDHPGLILDEASCRTQSSISDSF